MKPPRAKPPSRFLRLFWPVVGCVWLAVVGYWVFVNYASGPSAAAVRNEGEKVVAILEEHKTPTGHCPRRLEDTRVANETFRRGGSFSYVPAANLRGYILTVSGGHTWRYLSPLDEWERLPTGG